MAHFSEVDRDGNVIRVVVISNADIVDSQGNEVEQMGIDLCNQHVGPGVWVQTSYNKNFRKIFGEPGKKYSAEADVFYDPVAPFPSWHLDEKFDWQPPTPRPGNGYYWDEDTLTWLAFADK